MLFAIYLYEDFIYEESVAIASVFPLQSSGEKRAEANTPEGKLVYLLLHLPLHSSQCHHGTELMK
jgi:hypothetical protein